MKKLIIQIILLFIPLTSFAGAPLQNSDNTEKSDIIASVNSGIYDKVIDVKLIPNDDGAKVFYYTDKIGRFDEQIQYKLGSTIIIKKDTTLDYYSASKNETASLIKENTYIFNYPKNISLSYSDNAIIITNNENKSIDLRGWNITGKEFLYTTNLSSKDSYKYNYQMKDFETINLISPDEKVNISFTYNIPKKVIKSVNIQSVNKEKQENDIENKIDIINTKINETGIISNGNINQVENQTGNIETNIESNSANLDIDKDTINPNSKIETNKILNNNEILNNNLKTSIVDNKKEKNQNPIILIISIIIILMIVGGAYIKLEKKIN